MVSQCASGTASDRSDHTSTMTRELVDLAQGQKPVKATTTILVCDQWFVIKVIIMIMDATNCNTTNDPIGIIHNKEYR